MPGVRDKVQPAPGTALDKDRPGGQDSAQSPRLAWSELALHTPASLGRYVRSGLQLDGRLYS